MRVLDFFRSKRNEKPIEQGIVLQNGTFVSGIARAYENLSSRLFTDVPFINSLTDRDIKVALAQYRVAGRYISQNSALGNRFLELCAINIIGAQGFTLKALSSFFKENTVQLDKRANDILETFWDDFMRPENLTIQGSLSGRELCQSLIRAAARDGEVFIQVIRGQGKYGVLLNVIPAELVDVTYEVSKTAEGNSVCMGIEKDVNGKVVAYHILQQSELSKSGGYINSGKRVRIDAKNMIHVYLNSSAMDSRGMTWFASVVKDMILLSKYDEAAVIAAKVGASKSMVITQTLDSEKYTGNTKPNSQGQSFVNMRPGGVEVLGPGQDIKTFDPTYPSEAYPHFVKAFHNRIAAGLNVAYSSLTEDMSGDSFSSGRIGLENERAMWKNRQAWFAETFLVRLYEVWLEMGLASNSIPLTLARMDNYKKVQFVGQNFNYIQPETDAKATILELENGLKTHSEILAEKGIDVEEFYAQLQTEKKLRDKYGILLPMDVVKNTMMKKEESALVDNTPQQANNSVSGSN